MKRKIQVLVKPQGWSPFASEHIFERTIDTSKYILPHPDKVKLIIKNVITKFEKSGEFSNASGWIYQWRVKKSKVSHVHIPHYWRSVKELLQVTIK